ncbi:BrnA antitoxin family protein [Pseudomonas quasicaspiana]|uniref:BrnA antitoxin family protein n=1 Tax=Pseudomonas quasicaspiana TaxID=2829821 RepID=UPI000F04A8BF|nr:BrnA antitoxin family protein [Pseudomonas quasicaspiana]MCD5971318.1 BrnA antitoxin family protein [Pseudomonas quasicaspiana]
MKEQYDFSNAKRGAVAPAKGKSRITIMLDDLVLQAARERADSQGIGYQTLINGLLREALGFSTQPLTISEPQARFSPDLSLNTFDRQQIEALEAQLNSMARSLQVFLSDARNNSQA